MQSRAIFNIFISALPSTRLFAFKRLLLKLFNVNVSAGVCINGGLKIYGRGPLFFGANSWIGLNTHIYLSAESGLYIGENCDIAPEVIFHGGSHDIGDSLRRAGAGIGRDITIGRGSWIGTRVTILSGCDLGEGCIVAAGAVLINKKYPANSIIAGVPAIVIKSLQ